MVIYSQYGLHRQSLQRQREISSAGMHEGTLWWLFYSFATFMILLSVTACECIINLPVGAMGASTSGRLGGTGGGKRVSIPPVLPSRSPGEGVTMPGNTSAAGVMAMMSGKGVVLPGTTFISS